jgi:hypothetical protein
MESVQKKIPLSGERLEAAIIAMESPRFLERLTACIVNLAKCKGFYSPFKDQVDLPGGKSAGDLAVDIVEKALDGTYTWDVQKTPNFTYFCLSRTESILSNWLGKNRRVKAMCPILGEDDASGELATNPVNTATDATDIYNILRLRDGDALGDRFLEDFALSMPDKSHEQSIVMAAYDDRQCANRPYCREKLKLSEGEYDAAIKRLLRRLPTFKKEWLTKNMVKLEDWQEAR